jgi:ribosomal protein L23
MRYPGKTRRSFLGRTAKSGAAGRRPSFKKAIVQLAAGEHIELYEVG